MMLFRVLVALSGLLCCPSGVFARVNLGDRKGLGWYGPDGFGSSEGFSMSNVRISVFVLHYK